MEQDDRRKSIIVEFKLLSYHRRISRIAGWTAAIEGTIEGTLYSLAKIIYGRSHY